MMRLHLSFVVMLLTAVCAFDVQAAAFEEVTDCLDWEKLSRELMVRRIDLVTSSKVMESKKEAERAFRSVAKRERERQGKRAGGLVFVFVLLMLPYIVA